MKLWITRPSADEICMGGLRHTRLWCQEPIFDHRPIRQDFELFDPATGEYPHSVWMEGGWSSEGGSMLARQFLKQDNEVKDKVWRLIYESVVLASETDPSNKTMTYDEHLALLEKDYDMRCQTHWKRFLLELDLRENSVRRIPSKYYDDNGIHEEASINEAMGTTSFFLDEDLTKPFYFEDYPHLEVDRSRMF